MQTGCRTGKGEKLSSRQAEPGQAIKSAVAQFLSISCATSWRRARYRKHYFKISHHYTLRRSIMREVLPTIIWGVPPAGGPLLQLPTAQAGHGSYPKFYLQNLANDRPPALQKLKEGDKSLSDILHEESAIKPTHLSVCVDLRIFTQSCGSHGCPMSKALPRCTTLQCCHLACRCKANQPIMERLHQYSSTL